MMGDWWKLAAPFLFFFTGGRFMQFLFFGLFIVVFVALYENRKSKALPKIRKIAALDAIEEVVGRAAEMGKPIHVSPGTPSFGESIETETVVGLAINSYVAGLCAKYDVRAIYTAALPEILPILQEVVKQAYLSAGKSDAYRDNDIRYLSDQINAYVSGVQGIVENEECVGNIIFGRMWGAAFMLFARASVAGKTLQIGGTANIVNVAHLMASCDYVCIGEEMYAAEAYITQEPKQVWTVFTQDLLKYAALALIIVGIALNALGNPAMITLLNL